MRLTNGGSLSEFAAIHKTDSCEEDDWLFPICLWQAVEAQRLDLIQSPLCNPVHGVSPPLTAAYRRL